MTNLTRWITALFLAVVNLIFSTTVYAQLNDPPALTSQDIDTYIEDGMTQLRIPGAAVALFENGKITHMRGFGKIGRSDTAVTPQTPFQIASVTKSMTALIVLQLAEEGILSIDDPVVKHIPYFRTLDPKKSNAITIRHLMNHSSGISTLDGNRYQRTRYRGADATERAVRKLAHAQLQSMPGEQFQYSNANYATLSHLIEKIEQRPYEEVIEARIFAKVGMQNSYVQIQKKSTVEQAKGHLQWFGLPREDHHVAGRMMMGAGGVTTSAEDLAKYLIALSGNDPRIIPPALIQSWENAPDSAYEFGWRHGIFDGQRVIFHDGGNPGFRSVVMYAPDTGKGALFLMNMSGTLEGELLYGSVRYALGMPATDISPPKFFQNLLKGTVAMTGFLALIFFLSVWRLLKTVNKPWYKWKWLRWTMIVLPSAGLLAFAFATWFYTPRLFGINFAGSSLFYPDLGILSLVQIIIALTWVIARSVLLVRRHRTFSKG